MPIPLIHIPRSRSLARYLLFALAPAVPLVGLVHLIVRSTVRSAEESAGRRAVAVAKLGSTAVDEYFRGLTSYVEAYSRNPALATAAASRDEGKAREILRSLLEGNGRVDRTFVTDSSGILWTDYPYEQPVIGKSFAHRDWFRGVSSRESTYVSTAYNRAAGKQERSIAVATPIRLPGGGTGGYLVAQVLVSSLQRQIAHSPEAGFGEIFVLDRLQSVVAVTGDHLGPALLGAVTSCVDRAASKPVIHRIEVDGRTYLVAQSRAPVLGGCVLAARGLDQSLAATHAIGAFLYAIAIAAALLVALFLSMALGRRERRIEDLRKQEARLAAEVAERTESLTRTVSRLRAEVGERMRAEASLRESERRFRGTFEQAAVGIAHFSAEGRILRANQKLGAILGVPHERLLLMSITDLVRPEDFRNREGCPEGDVLQGLGEWKEGICEVERELLRGDGSRVWCQITLAPVTDERGEAEYFTGVVEDVSERKRLEEEVVQSQKMRAIGQLAGGVAHDFNNLLTTILGYAELLQRRLTRGDLARSYADEIMRAGQRGSALTAQLLAFGRKQMLRPIPINLNDVVRGMEGLLQRLTGDLVTLEMDLDPSLHTVKADLGQVEQVLMNLVVNARDAMPAGGEILIETRNVEVDEAAAQDISGIAPGAYAEVTVTDNGMGMDAATRARLFEPFFTTKEMGKGTGLGLSMVYGIVKQSGGAITVTSEPGQGSSFRVYLPRTELPAVPIRTEELPVSGSNGADRTPLHARAHETVLLVEDEVGLRAMARQTLEENGYDVLEAENGAEAIAIAETHEGPLHAVLTDVKMPRMSGATLAERVRQIFPDVKVVFVSGFTEESVFGQVPPDPNVTFVQKPYTPTSLLRVLREVLERTGPGVIP
ncbi:MAG TPA: ATP-binding protein [Candidatus Eisenbacteria bacterium]|nr:ATP-binding protein [Candidatus Eisenbacteria bacterium]